MRSCAKRVLDDQLLGFTLAEFDVTFFSWFLRHYFLLADLYPQLSADSGKPSTPLRLCSCADFDMAKKFIRLEPPSTVLLAPFSNIYHRDKYSRMEVGLFYYQPKGLHRLDIGPMHRAWVCFRSKQLIDERIIVFLGRAWRWTRQVHLCLCHTQTQ